MDERKALEEIAASAARGDMVFPTHAEMALRVWRALDETLSGILEDAAEEVKSLTSALQT